MFAVEKFGVAYKVTVYLEVVGLSGWDTWCSATQKLQYIFSSMEEVKEFIDNSLTGDKQDEIQKTK